jgi:hypothetical protein
MKAMRARGWREVRLTVPDPRARSVQERMKTSAA